MLFFHTLHNLSAELAAPFRRTHEKKKYFLLLFMPMFSARAIRIFFGVRCNVMIWSVLSKTFCWTNLDWDGSTHPEQTLISELVAMVWEASAQTFFGQMVRGCDLLGPPQKILWHKQTTHIVMPPKIIEYLRHYRKGLTACGRL